MASATQDVIAHVSDVSDQKVVTPAPLTAPPTAATPAAAPTAAPPTAASAVAAATPSLLRSPSGSLRTKPNRASQKQTTHERLSSVQEEDTVSETSVRVQNKIDITSNPKYKTKSVEVIVDEKFHQLFDAETLQIDKLPPLTSTVRFTPAVLTDISNDRLSPEDRTQLSALRSFTEIREMMNTKFSFKEGRLSSTLDILAQYMRGQKVLYLEAKAYCEFYLYRLMIPTIVISSACSVVSGVFNDMTYAAIAVAAASAFNTFLLALINYFKLDARAEAHRMTAYSFDQLISECEFMSGKILLSNLVQDDDLTADAEQYKLKDVQDFMSLIENKVKEIKQKNQFIIPDSIRHAFPNIYYTNIFALVTQSQIQEMIITNQLKMACNAFAEVENQIIKGDRRPEIYMEFNHKQRQKNDLIEKILDHRMNMVTFDQVLRFEVGHNRKRCLWIRCCY